MSLAEQPLIVEPERRIEDPWAVKDMCYKARDDVQPRLTQTQLAEKITEITGEKVNRQRIGQWESGEAEPTISQWWALIEVTGAEWLRSRCFSLVPSVGGQLEIPFGEDRPNLTLVTS